MTATLIADAPSLAPSTPTTAMTHVAVRGTEADAVAEVLERLAARLRGLGPVEVHDVVVTVGAEKSQGSTATAYFSS